MKIYCPDVEGNRRGFVEVINKQDLVYLYIARAHVDLPKCRINVLFHHTILMESVFWASVLIIAREGGRLVSTISISSQPHVFVHKELHDSLKHSIERGFGQLFFKK